MQLLSATLLLFASFHVHAGPTLIGDVFDPRNDNGKVIRDIPLKKFPAPKIFGKTHKLWATYYNTPIYNVGGNHVLNTMDDEELGHNDEPAALSHRQYCDAAMEGSVRIVYRNGDAITYNYAGVKSPALIDCSPYFGNRFPATNKVRFRMANSTWGDGVRQYSLIPYRTIAVNPRKVPYGTVVYIKKAVGTKIKLPNGEIFEHDGFFFAGDTGGAMRRDATHIDMFIGNSTKNPFKFVKSKPSGKFTLKVIRDEAVTQHLTDLHESIHY